MLMRSRYDERANRAITSGLYHLARLLLLWDNCDSVAVEWLASGRSMHVRLLVWLRAGGQSNPGSQTRQVPPERA